MPIHVFDFAPAKNFYPAKRFSRPFQPLRQQRTGGNPAGVELSGLGRPANRLAFGIIVDAVFSEQNRAEGKTSRLASLAAGFHRWRDPKP